jgi:hypothetical protein
MTPPEASGSGRDKEASREPDAVGRLKRWQDSGAVWRVMSLATDTVTISLCRCDGGEEVDRLTSDDPDLLRWLDGRTSSDQ